MAAGLTKPPLPEVLRKGAIVRVAASDAEAARTARADAVSYVVWARS